MTIILYVRDPYSWFVSAYGQNLKLGKAFCLSFKEFLDERMFRVEYSRIASVWAEVFGKGQVLIRSYDFAKTVGLQGDLMSLLSLPNDLIPEEPHMNIRKSDNDFAWIRTLNRIELYFYHLNKTRAWIRKLRRLSRFGFGNGLKFKKELRQWEDFVLRETESQIREFAKTWLDPEQSKYLLARYNRK